MIMISVGSKPINEAVEVDASKPWMVLRDRGGSIGEKKCYPTFFSDETEAKEAAKRRNKNLSPGEKKYYGIHYAAIANTENNRKKYNVAENAMSVEE